MTALSPRPPPAAGLRPSQGRGPGPAGGLQGDHQGRLRRWAGPGRAPAAGTPQAPRRGRSAASFPPFLLSAGRGPRTEPPSQSPDPLRSGPSGRAGQGRALFAFGGGGCSLPASSPASPQMFLRRRALGPAGLRCRSPEPSGSSSQCSAEPCLGSKRPEAASLGQALGLPGKRCTAWMLCRQAELLLGG